MKIYRLDYAKLFLVIITLFLISCGRNDDSVEFEVVRTVVKGNVRDVERNKNISNFKVKLVRSSIFVTLGGSGIQSEEVSTVLTDDFGNYEIEFDYIKDGKNYGFEQVYYGYPYHTQSLGNSGPIIPGGINIYNFDVWRPVKIKLHLQVRNNNFPHLRVNSTVVESGYSLFPQASIFERDLDTIVFLDSKPNSTTELNFHYTSGNSNSDYHSRKEIVQTTLQDTIEFSYVIDCATF